MERNDTPLIGFVRFDESGIDAEMLQQLFPGQARWLPVVAALQLEHQPDPNRETADCVNGTRNAA